MTKYLAASTVVAILAFWDTDGIGGALVLVWTVGAAAALVWQSRLPRPEGPSILPILGWTGFLLAAGVVIRSIHGALIDQPFPFPSPADLLHFPAYVLMVTLLWKLYRARSTGTNVDAWLDGIALSHAIAIIAWVTFYGDFVFDDTIPFLTRLANAPFDITVAISAIIVLRISATPGARPHAYRLLAWSFAALAFVDLAAAVTLARGTGLSLTVALSPFAASLAVAAARHESVHEVLKPHQPEEVRYNKLRLGLISISLLAPVFVVVFHRNAEGRNLFVVIGLVISLAVVMTIRAVRIVHDHQRATELERTLATEVARLAQEDSTPERLRREILISSRKLLPVRAHIAIGEAQPDQEDLWSVPLTPDGQKQSNSNHLLVRNYRPDPREERLLRTLLIDGERIMRASNARMLDAKAKSEAEAAHQIAINERRFRALVQNASDLVLVIDHDASITYMSEASQRILGREAESCVGQDVRELLIQGDVSDANRYVAAVLNDSPPAQDLEVRLLHSDGSTRLFECAFTDMFNVEGVNGLVINATDVTNQRTLERDLLNAATTDPLTLMLNRSAFINEISSAMRSASLTGAGVSVAIINIDNFRQLNESLGPVLADQVLINSSHAIRRSVRLADSVARLWGGEFAVLFPTVSEASEAAALVERVLEELAIPMSVGEKDLEITARAGISTGGDTTLDGPALVRQADTALDTARRNADHRVVLYEEEMGEAASERIDIRDRLNGSIDNGELRLVYQPIVDFATGDIVSMESLARWEHPERGNIPPDVFIPIAESSGYIDKLGDWALETACLQLIEWNDLGLVGLTISVNMSAHQIRANDIVDRVQSILRRTGVDPTSVVIEITESVLIDDTDFIASRINALRGLGLGLAIDDFGTGYSSLSYLQRYAFDILKIDRSFVTDLDQAKNARRAEVVRSIVSLAKGLGALTVAEGVEEESERRELKKLGCDRAQGFLFYTPVEASEVPAILAAKSVSLRAA